MFLDLAHTKTPVYQQSQNLVLESYRITKTFPAEEKFGMVQQIRRAVLSVHLNLAEGCSRNQSLRESDILKLQEVLSLKLMRQSDCHLSYNIAI